MNSKKSKYVFGEKYKVFKKDKKKKDNKGDKKYNFTAIRPYIYEKSYGNGTVETFEYIEIHTKNHILAFLIKLNINNKKKVMRQFLDTAEYPVDDVLDCLELTTAIPTKKFEKELPAIWSIEDIVNQAGHKGVSIDDIELIYADPNAKFLLCYLAYSVLASCGDDIWPYIKPNRIKTDIPFLLSVYYEFKKGDKFGHEKYHNLKAYLRMVHSACYMPNGDFVGDRMPISAVDYEYYVNYPSRANNIALIETKGLSVNDALPLFTQTIEAAEMEYKDYPYSSLPFIMTLNEEALPQKYFLKFNADEIKIDAAIIGNFSAVAKALTRIMQASCAYLKVINERQNGKPHISSTTKFQALIGELKQMYPFVDTSSKRADDLTYLVKIILRIIPSAFVFSSTKYSHDRINKLLVDAFLIMLQDYNMSEKQLANSKNAKALPIAAPITKLLNCIVEDFESSGVFDSDSPIDLEEYNAVNFAFIYDLQGKELLCFKRQGKGVSENTFEKYLQEKGLWNDENTADELWDTLEAEHKGLILRNHNKYYRYPKVMKDVYALDIAAVKEYLDQHKTL